MNCLRMECYYKLYGCPTITQHHTGARIWVLGWRFKFWEMKKFVLRSIIAKARNMEIGSLFGKLGVEGMNEKGLYPVDVLCWMGVASGKSLFSEQVDP